VAAPGYSEHHTGRALDIGDGVAPSLDEALGRTAALAWPICHAGSLGFRPAARAGHTCGFIPER
jgi:D-alanyl-D-alanine carboxypeptidase